MTEVEDRDISGDLVWSKYFISGFNAVTGVEDRDSSGDLLWSKYFIAGFNFRVHCTVVTRLLCCLVIKLLITQFMFM